jgi:acyl dehydratase
MAAESYGKFYEDLEIGATFRTMGRTITEADVVGFGSLVGLFEEMFINAEYARSSSVFKGRIVPGQLVQSYAEGLVVLTGLLRGTGLALLSVTAQIIAPCFIGDTITVNVTVTEKRLTSKPDRGIVTTRNLVQNQRDETVMEIVPIRLIRCQPRS